MTDDATLIADLSRADHLPEKALRAALARPEALAGETLRLLEAAAEGTELSPEEQNLMFWGLHVLAHARDARALPPLLRLLRQDNDTLDLLLGDAVTSTLPRVVASLFDGQTEALFALVLDSTADDYVRHSLLGACVFLTLDRRIGREAMQALLIRFDDAHAAVEGDMAWIGWEEAIAYLGFRDLVPRAEAARRDKRITDEFSDAAWFKDTLRAAEAKPEDRKRLDHWHHGYLDDPLEQLAWTKEGAGQPQRNPFKDVGRNDRCPCGSGRKFKKCCLGKEQTETVGIADVLSVLEAIPRR
ncbi:DUF1186 domain-containing protein [Methylobacterium trifolii]|uniref:DUF1186 domain-containing protein n=1 Tax=Methylobacterium trifolii TaxID=1003092 RepID=A0ABQ4U1L4_9HYPH|nr:DUF1186 domain-containing protein [Methylobacterium trifolii]GJE60203.1 hypothetical protein MPOCJGCO_2314 [Methylobacterium trifolii]